MMFYFYEFEQWNIKLKESPVSLTIWSAGLPPPRHVTVGTCVETD